MPQDTTNNAFSGTTDDQPVVTNPPIVDQAPGVTQKTYTFQEGDRVKTFTGSDEIFNAYANSQQFIGTLKGEKSAVELELETLKSKYDEMSSHQVSTQEVLDQINSTQAQPTGTQEAQTSSLNQNDIVTAVREQLTLEQGQETFKANVAQANSALTSVYGDSASEHVTKVAGNNGMTVQEAQSLAGSNPLLFKNLFLPTDKLNATSVGFSTPQSSITTKQLQQDPSTQPVSDLMWQQKENQAVQTLRTKREELRKQMQL